MIFRWMIGRRSTPARLLELAESQSKLRFPSVEWTPAPLPFRKLQEYCSLPGSGIAASRPPTERPAQGPVFALALLVAIGPASWVRSEWVRRGTCLLCQQLKLHGLSHQSPPSALRASFSDDQQTTNPPSARQPNPCPFRCRVRFALVRVVRRASLVQFWTQSRLPRVGIVLQRTLPAQAAAEIATLRKKRLQQFQRPPIPNAARAMPARDCERDSARAT